jgi:hypothetical protein
MAEKLSVEIGAEIAGLEKGLKKANKDISKFGTTANKSLSNVGKTTTNAGKGFKSLNKNVKGSVPAMTSFSQVIQDAPFGIRGVANNIQQLTMQMGHLSANAGGTKNALKAMLGTLAGPAGILLIVSIVTSLMVSFGDSMFKSTTEAEKLKKAQDKLTESLKKYEESLASVQKTELDGSKTAVKRLTELSLLTKQLDDTTLSEGKRLAALNELKKIYPSYFANISKEVALTKGLGDEHEALTKVLTNNSRAEAAEKEINTLEKLRLALESRLGTEDKILKLERDLTKERAKTPSLASLAKIEVLEKGISEAKRKGNRFGDEGLATLKEIEDIDLNILALTNQIKAAGGIVPLDFGQDGAAIVKKSAKDKKEAWVQELVDYTNYTKLYNDLEKNYLNNLQVGAQKYMETRAAGLEASKKANNAEITELERFNMAATSVIENGISNTFANLGTVIGEGLASGGNVLKAAGSVLLSGLGGILIDLGKMAIKVGVGLLAVKLALKTLNPYAAIAAGVGLVAIGSMFSKGAKSLGGSMGSGSSGVSGAGDSGGFSSSGNFSGQLGGFQNIRFELEGTTLIGVINNSMRQDVNMGGSIGLLNT